MGNTLGNHRSNRSRTVHPHACGEHGRKTDRSFLSSGSSPRLWGTLTDDSVRAFRERFIPTPVGNTRSHGFLRTARTVHPHACGEYDRICRCPSGGRFIPTPVGNTRSHGFLRTARTVHPHACGEYDRICRCPFGGRFIPTPVGNTTATNPRLVQVPVHPHACGEHFALPKQLKPSHGSSPRLWGTLSLNRPKVAPFGSSPRLWGTRRKFRVLRSQARFIPTPVGNT